MGMQITEEVREMHTKFWLQEQRMTNNVKTDVEKYISVL